jgi:periplasmic copper chaperone A
VEKVMEKLAEPVRDTHGNEVTERVGQVVYITKNPLPEGYRDAFELSLQIPDVAGETLVFPVIQTCEKGETAWVETAAVGSTEELEAPAPLVAVLAAEEEADVEPASDETTTAETDAVTTDEGGSNTWGVLGLVAGLLGLGAGSAALLQGRQRS